MHAIYCSPLAQSTLLAKYLIKVGKFNWKNAKFMNVLYFSFLHHKYLFLIPKGLLSPIEKIGSLDSITWCHFFKKSLKLFVNMRLGISFARVQFFFIILDFRIKSYRETKNSGEVWAGQASAITNQQELTTCAQKWGGRKRILQGGKMGTNVGEVGDC